NVATVKEPLEVLVTIEAGDVVVRNAIRPRASAARSTGFGLESIIKRYAAITARPVVVLPGDGDFTVRIPLITSS
ncbi:MAG TPA: histidine kinase, partial [Flavobacteriales bacterium]|nr:histidine kinase [Flavobacteriales bacterium]